jgi:hypothetical protein
MTKIIHFAIRFRTMRTRRRVPFTGGCRPNHPHIEVAGQHRLRWMSKRRLARRLLIATGPLSKRQVRLPYSGLRTAMTDIGCWRFFGPYMILRAFWIPHAPFDLTWP